MYVLCLDALGGINWSIALGGAGVETGWDIALLPDGGSIAVGSSNSFGDGSYDGYVIRLDVAGQVLWQRTYGSDAWDFLYSVDVLDDGFLLAGSTYGTTDGSSDMWLIRTDLDGDTLWTRTYGGDADDEARSVIALGTDGCVLGGTLRTGGSEADAVMIKYDATGQEEWSAELGGADEDVGFSVEAVESGGFVIAGYTRSFGPVRQMFMAKVDATGGEEWERNISGAGDDWEARSVRERVDGTFAVAGYTEEYGAGGRDFSLLFVNAQGDFISGPTYGGGEDDEAWSVDFTADDGYLIAGSTKSYGPGSEAMFVIRSDGDTLNGAVVTSLDPVGIEPVAAAEHVRIYPQPVAPHGSMFIAGSMDPLLSARITSVQGALTTSLVVEGTTLVLPGLVPGIYVLELASRSGAIFRGPLIVQ